MYKTNKKYNILSRQKKYRVRVAFVFYFYNSAVTTYSSVGLRLHMYLRFKNGSLWQTVKLSPYFPFSDVKVSIRTTFEPISVFTNSRVAYYECEFTKGKQKQIRKYLFTKYVL